MIWFRNFVHTLRRFLLASVTNLLGLAVAFGAFYVIMTQVDYDLNFDKGYDGYQDIVRIDIQTSANVSDRQLWICRPMADMIVGSSPHIVGSSCLQGYNMDDELWIGDKKLGTVDVVMGFDDFVSIFRPKMIVGETSALLGHKVLIPRSVAMRCFGRADCVGETLHLGEKSAGKDVEVGGVFYDFPANSTMRNGVYDSYSEDNNDGDNWQQYNYNLYLRLDDANMADDVVKTAYDYLIKNAPAEAVGSGDGITGAIHYTRMEDVHFSNVGTPAETSSTTLCLLLIISIAVVCVAAINFMNFSLAETPMRIRSINTQKVLGASVSSLRANLILECVVVCFVAVLLGGVAVMACRNLGLQDIVQGDISLSEHPLLVALTVGVAVLAGLLAGIYPAFYATSIPPAVALKGNFGLSKSGNSLRTLLIGIQFVVAFALVVCILIMYAQIRHISTANYGLDKDSIIMGVTTKQIYQHRDAVRSELMAVSGVENVSFSSFTMGADMYPCWGRGKDNDHVAHFFCLRCDCHFIETMGIKIVDGRDFNETDNGAFIFNEAAMKEYPWFTVGQAPWKDGDDDGWPIVGVCDNIRYRSMRYDNNFPMAFCIYPKEMDWYMGKYNIRISKGVDIKGIVDSLHKTLDKYYDDGNADFRFMNDRLNLLYKSENRFSSQILLFSVIAIFISLMGVMGISMFEAEYRRKEIAVRKVLGCSTCEVVMMFVRRYAMILAICFVIGAPLGYVLSQHWMSGFADRVATSPLVFLFSLVSVSFLTLATVTVQVWRTASANPVDAIKS